MVVLLTAGLGGSAQKERVITLAFGGDVMLGRLVDETVKARGPRYVWGNVLPLLRDADAALVNLECVISEPGERFPNRVFYFRAEPETGRALSEAGIDYVSLANNHAMDFRAQGLIRTIDHLDHMAIAHAGAGRNLEAAATPAFVNVSGIKIGVVAFADHFREYAASHDSPGINWIELKSFERVRAAIDAARKGGADLIVFSIHWGPNMREQPTSEFIEFAHAVMDAGADIFHGHSAHIFQGIEIYKGKLILYDTGDLIDDYYVDPQLRNDQQLLFIVRASSRGAETVELVPLFIRNMQVNLAEGDEFEAIFERARRLSSSFGTKIERKHDRLVIQVAGTQAGPK
jgi:poly-gamma-glutamate capsule biosynthesis protein CapA/YwtB (metallophosphatase superfamily)